MGIFAGDLCNLTSEAEDAWRWGCRILHFDVMDGVFVPQLTGGAGFLSGLAGGMVKDVHLMVHRPADHVAHFVAAGADIVTVHAESEGADVAIDKIRSAAMGANREVLAGVSLMPETSFEDAKHVLSKGPDLFLVLALDPRNKEPADIVRACCRVEAVRKRFPNCLVAFDGGVTLETMPEIARVQPDIVVSGSAIMGAQDRRETFRSMHNHL